MKHLIKFEQIWIDLEEIAGCEVFQDQALVRVKISLRGGSTFFLSGDEAEEFMEVLDRWSLRLDGCSKPFHSPTDPSWAYTSIWESLIDINNSLVEAIAILCAPISEEKVEETDSNLRRVFNNLEVVASKSLDRV
ncbi:MAG: hypothetical protein ACRC8A_16940 [Microcoleaceae cyanobacterium]